MSNSAASIIELATSAGNLGLAAVVLYMFFNGKLHSDAELTAVRQDLVTTQAALERTQAALALSNARNETGILSAEIIAQTLGARSRRQEDDDRRRERRDEDDDRRAYRDREDGYRQDRRAGEDEGYREGHHVVPATED
jgi:hypothetical protein